MSNFFTKKNIIIIVAILLAILAFVFLCSSVLTHKAGDLSESSDECIFRAEKATVNFNNYNFNLMLTKIMAICIIVGAVAVLGFGVASFFKADLLKFFKIASIALAVFAIIYFIGGISFTQSMSKFSNELSSSLGIESKTVPGIGIILPFAFGILPAVASIFAKD